MNNPAYCKYLLKSDFFNDFITKKRPPHWRALNLIYAQGIMDHLDDSVRAAGRSPLYFVLSEIVRR
jgi:hypothetical protein